MEIRSRCNCSLPIHPLGLFSRIFIESERDLEDGEREKERERERGREKPMVINGEAERWITKSLSRSSGRGIFFCKLNGCIAID